MQKEKNINFRLFGFNSNIFKYIFFNNILKCMVGYDNILLNLIWYIYLSYEKRLAAPYDTTGCTLPQSFHSWKNTP